MAESLIPEHSLLFGRLLVLVAHPDDETVGCGGLLQRTADAMVVFATDGAPRDKKFWSSFGSREEYALARRREAEKTIPIAGVLGMEFLNIPDQELFCNLDKAFAELVDIVEKYRPHVFLTHAYEGGHPDHDACSFLVLLLARRHGIPAWELPLYHRAVGNRALQQFIPLKKTDREEMVLTATPEERDRKLRMVAAYPSQGDIVKDFDITREIFRPQPAYDYTKPPHAGVLNYEEWRWTMTGQEVSKAFGEMLQEKKVSAQGR